MMLAKGDLKQCHIFFLKIFQCTCYNIHKNMHSKTCHGVIDVRIIDASSSQLISSFSVFNKYTTSDCTRKKALEVWVAEAPGKAL